MHLSIPSTKKQQLFEQLQHANLAFQQRYPGDLPNRQAVHTVYGGANLFKHDLAINLGKKALETFETYAPNTDALPIKLCPIPSQGIDPGSNIENVMS